MGRKTIYDSVGRPPADNKIDNDHYRCTRCGDIRHKSNFHKVLLKYNKRGFESQCKVSNKLY